MISPQIIFSDSNYLVLNKPAGMIVNNADTSLKEYTVQDFIKKNYKLLVTDEDTNSEFLKREGIVHRLDKETSGALIVALNSESFHFLQNQFKERTVIKEYLAVCHGKMIPESEINVPIGRLPWNRMRFGVIPQGRESYTKFSTISHHILKEGRNSTILSLLKVLPQTGRTHQIRVHLQYAGHPIYGDALYAGRKTILRDRKNLNRHFLHASQISFVSPSTKKRVSFESPLTTELANFMAMLKPYV